MTRDTIPKIIAQRFDNSFMLGHFHAKVILYLVMLEQKRDFFSIFKRRPLANTPLRSPGRQETGHYYLSLQPTQNEAYHFKARSQITFTLDSGMDEKKYGVGFAYDISIVFSKNTSGQLVADMRFGTAQGGTVLNEGFVSDEAESDEDAALHWGIMWDIVKSTSLVVTLTPRGVARSVKGESAMLKQLISRIGARNPSKLPLDLKSWNSWIIQSTLKRLVVRMFQLFPAEEVKENNTWTLVLNDPGVVPVEVISTLSIEEIRGDLVKLKTSGPVACHKTYSDLFYEPSTWTLNGRENGGYTIDLPTGLLLYGHVKGTADGFYTYYRKDKAARMEYELSIDRTVEK
jgi:hypothetical protein